MNKFTKRKKNKLNKKVKTRKQFANKAKLLSLVGMREKTDAEKKHRYIEEKIVKGGNIKVKHQEAQDKQKTPDTPEAQDPVTKSVNDTTNNVTKSVNDTADKVTESINDRRFDLN